MGAFIPEPLEGLWLTLVEVTQISHPLPTQGCLCIDCHESHRKKNKTKKQTNHAEMEYRGERRSGLDKPISAGLPDKMLDQLFP